MMRFYMHFIHEATIITYFISSNEASKDDDDDDGATLFCTHAISNHHHHQQCNAIIERKKNFAVCSLSHTCCVRKTEVTQVNIKFIFLYPS